MNQTCKVCGEPAAGFHFGAFTCEGCKSFFGRSYNNLSSISECKNSGKCIIDKKNRTTCKACRLRKCYTVGMSKGGSRYGRRSNWFKIHCLLQEQQQQAVDAAGKGGAPLSPNGFGDMAAAAAAAAAQQHMQQRNSHMAMGGLLGYPGYLPEMMQTSSPFMSAAPGVRHPADAAAAAAALPFFNMMSSLPTIGSQQSAFQLPPHLLFSGYSHNAAAAAAADAAYRSEMYKHRQSVDSTNSAESQRFSPSSHSQTQRVEEPRISPAASVERESPELCVSGDDVHSQPSPTIYSPVAIRASPKMGTPVTPPTEPHTPEAVYHSNSNTSTTEMQPQISPLSFAAKMQSLSPVSICSISAETSAAPTAAVGTNQDGPMDLSMKTSRSSVHSFNTSNGESELHSDSSEEDHQHQHEMSLRRKYQHLAAAHESDLCSDASNNSESAKRQKISNEAPATNSYNGFAHNAATSLRRIFVCV